MVVTALFADMTTESVEVAPNAVDDTVENFLARGAITVSTK